MFSFRARAEKSIVQSLNSPFFPPHIGAEPGRAKEKSRITYMRMPRTNQSKITRSQPRRSRQCVAQCLFQLALCKGGGKRGHIVAETLLLMTFPCARKLGNICCGHKMFLNKIRNIFVSRTQNLCPQQMLRARANGETFVSATMCPQQCVLVCQYLKKTFSLALILS